MAELKRVMVFIDGSNLYHTMRANHSGVKLDFAKLATAVVGPNRELIRVYYYNAPVNQSEVPIMYAKQQKFFNMIERLDYYELRRGKLVKDHKTGKVREKGVDVRLSLDMLAYASEDLYDVAVLISGDADMVVAVKYVKNHGKHVELAFPQSSARSDELMSVCDKYQPFDNAFLKKVAQK